MLSEFPFLYRFKVLLNSGGSNSLWSEFWPEFPHFMGMGVVRVHAKGGRTLRKGVFLPSKRLLSAFYKTLPSKNPSKKPRSLPKTLTGAF